MQRRRQRDIILLLRGQVVAAGQLHQPVQQRLGDDADVPHMRAGLAVAELHDLAQHAYQHIGVLFAGADLVGHHLHQPPLLGIQLDGVDHPAVDDLGVKGAADVIACAQLIRLADGFFRVVAGDHDHRHILDGVVGVHGAQHLKAVHDRHIDIQQHQRDLPRLFPQQLQTLFAVPGFQNAVVPAQNAGKHHAVHHGIVHQQDAGLFLQDLLLSRQPAVLCVHRYRVLVVLGLIHQKVCPAHHILHGVGKGLHRAADAQRKPEVRVARHHSLLHGIADLLQLCLEVICRDAGQHQQKFIAAVADQQIRLPDTAADGLCNGFQCQISGVVAVGIVADLEIVDIHQGDARRAEVIAHHILVIAAVVGTGQSVMVQPLPVALFFFHIPSGGLGKLSLLLLHLLHHPQQVAVGGFQCFPLGAVLLFQLFPQLHIGGDIRDSAHDIAIAAPFHPVGSTGDPAVAVFAQHPEDVVALLCVSRAVFCVPVAQPVRQIIRVQQRGVAVIELCRKFCPLPAQYLQKTFADISKRIAVFRVLCAAVKTTRYILCIAFQPQKSFFYRLVYFHLVFPASFSVYRTLTARGTPCCRNLPSYDAPILGVL